LDFQGNLDHLDLSVHQELLAPLDQLDHLDNLDLKEPKAYLVPKVVQVELVLQANLDQLDH
jgi:hypothetical protein